MSTSTPDAASAVPSSVLPSQREPAGAAPDGVESDEAVHPLGGRSASGSPAEKGSTQPKDVLIVALGAGLLVTTPLALLTLRRWWRWWNDLGS